MAKTVSNENLEKLLESCNDSCSLEQRIIKSNKNLAKLLKLCREYKGDSFYVYKLCCDSLSKKDKSRKWLVILKKLWNTKTNEGRPDVVDYQCAKFRGNVFGVIKIINTNKPTLVKKYIVNEYVYENTRSITIYETGMIVYPDHYDGDIKRLCSGGIHYFKSPIPAFYFRNDIPTNYTGKWFTFRDDGEILHELDVVDGEGTHYVRYWSKNIKEAEGSFLNTKQSGIWIRWDHLGNKISEKMYVNGEIVGSD